VEEAVDGLWTEGYHLENLRAGRLSGPGGRNPDKEVLGKPGIRAEMEGKTEHQKGRRPRRSKTRDMPESKKTTDVGRSRQEEGGEIFMD